MDLLTKGMDANWGNPIFVLSQYRWLLSSASGGFKKPAGFQDLKNTVFTLLKLKSSSVEIVI
jgi:hypothetical protein